MANQEADSVYYVGDEVFTESKSAPHKKVKLNSHEYQGLVISKEPQRMSLYEVVDTEPQQHNSGIKLKEYKSYSSKKDLPAQHGISAEDGFKQDLDSNYVGFPPRVPDRLDVEYAPVTPALLRRRKKKNLKPLAKCCLVFLALSLVAVLVFGIIGSIANLYIGLNRAKQDIERISTSNSANSVSTTTGMSTVNNLEATLSSFNTSIGIISSSLGNYIKLSNYSSVLIRNSVSVLNATVQQLGANMRNILDSLTGQVSSKPAASCPDVLQATPSALSGYYWTRSTNGTIVQMYCDMTRVCGGVGGGWARVALLDMRDLTTHCPDGLCLNETPPRTCRKCTAAGGCTRTEFSVPVAYSKVCGKVIGYQIGSPDGFITSEMDADGIDLSRGEPRTHIWTFVAGRTEDTSHTSSCPCLNTGRPGPPAKSYIGNNYFCDTADQFFNVSLAFHSDDPLWDSRGCNVRSTCCSFNNPPWFYRDMNVTSTSPVVMRICLDQGNDDEDVGLEQVELYVQ